MTELELLEEDVKDLGDKALEMHMRGAKENVNRVRREFSMAVARLSVYKNEIRRRSHLSSPAVQARLADPNYEEDDS